MTHVIAFYEIDRCYGGGEEGGWWYDTGDLVRPYRIVRDEDQAYAIARRANHLLRFIQRNVRDVGSVIYDGGRFAAHVFEDQMPAHFPESRPHYE